MENMQDMEKKCDVLINYYSPLDATKMVDVELKSIYSWPYNRQSFNSVEGFKFDNAISIIDVYYSGNDQIDLDKISIFSKKHLNEQINKILVLFKSIICAYAKKYKIWVKIEDVFNKIKKDCVDTYVKNFYDKLSHNTANYSDGGPIKDLYDAIMNDIFKRKEIIDLFKKYLFTIQTSSVIKNIKFNVNLVNIREDEIDNTVHITNKSKELDKEMTISEIDSTYHQYCLMDRFRSLSKRMFYNIFINEISRLLQNYIFTLKEMNYINKDCRAFFSRLATITYENEETYTKALQKLPKDINYYIYKVFDNIGRNIVMYFSKDKYGKIKKTDMENFRKDFAKKFCIESKFTEYFTNFVALKSLYDQYHRDVYYYKTTAIDDKVNFDNTYDRLLALFYYNFNYLIDKVSSFAIKEMNVVIKNGLFNENVKRDPYYKNTTLEFQFISSYLRVIRTFLKESGTIKTYRALKNKIYDSQTFANGIAHDFMNTKSIIRLYKRFNYSDEQIEKISKNFAFYITKPLYDLTIESNKNEDCKANVLHQFNYLYKKMNELYRDIDDLKHLYTGTITEEIFRSCYGIRRSYPISPSIKYRSSRFIKI